jgi:hypothetical protein
MPALPWWAAEGNIKGWGSNCWSRHTVWSSETTTDVSEPQGGAEDNPAKAIRNVLIRGTGTAMRKPEFWARTGQDRILEN